MVNDIEQRLNTHDLAISQLEANTKWLYKYGGVGGKGGNGTSSDSSNYNIYCEFDNIPINNNESKIYKAGKHKLKVTITKHGGLSYNVKPIVQSQIDSSNTSNANPSSAVLSLETTYSKEFTLTINENSNVIISVTSSDGEPKSFTFSVITNPYIFELTYNRDNGNPYNVTSMNNSELMINDLSINGFNITLTYNIGITADISYITQSSIESINNLSGDITNTSGKINFTIDKSFLIYENSGLYNFNIILTIKEENSLPYEYPISCSFFLIPSTLFLLIYPEDNTKTIYYSSNGNEPYSSENIPLSNYFDEYNNLITKESLTEEEKTRLNYIQSTVSYSNNGIIGLVGKIYFGGNQQRIFTLLNNDGSSIKIYPNDSEEAEDIYLSFTSVTERKAFNFAPYINNVNKNKLVFTINDNNNIQYEFVYYLYTSQESTSLTWINTQDIIIDTENYWRNGIGTSAFNNLNGKSYIDTYTNSLNDIILTSSLVNPNNNVDLFISFGIQYNFINDDDHPILTISSNSNDLVIYQNKITYLGKTCKIYIPKEENYNQGLNSQYHLLSISLRKISYSSNDTYYQFVVYIDGTIEGAFTSYLTTVETFNSIKFNPCNASLNLIELSYFGNTITQNQRQFTESDIDRYWYSYCENYGIQNLLYNNDTLALLDIFKKINYEVESTNLYSLQNAQISQIALAVDIPVMIISISTITNIGALASYGGDVLTWFTTAANDSTPSLQVDSVSWSPGKADFKKYKLSDYSKIQGAYWYIEIQGSSTKGRKVKNLNLGIKNNGDNAVLFTPNFKKITSSMSNNEQIEIGNSAFLPEQIYTLKADIVDSSHCNNVSIGKFVNDATPKFSNAQQSNSKYNQYIKNCLTGFPFLLFFEIQNNEENEYYYVGIYNFNLGRNSYFNLGYNSFEGLDNYIENVIEEEKGTELSEGFGIYALDYHYTQHLQSLFVTEIQSGSIQNQTHEGGGGNVYDFSQFHPSILGIDGKNSGMFGDFENDTTISANLTTTLPKFVKSVAKAGAYIFMSLKKNIDSDILTSDHPVGDYNVGYSRSLDNTMTGKYVSINHVPDFLLEAYRDNDSTGHPVYFRKPNDPLYQGILKDANINFDFNTYLDGNHTTVELLQDLLNALPNTTETGWLETSILEIIGKIEDELDTQEVPLDYTSLVWYYVICMAMGLVDSVCKNLNLKSWNASGDSLGKMYTAFYDMDTALGRDNFGRSVSYFAFSDYWTNNFNTSGTNEIDPITIYRDFFPLIDDNSEIIGYDIPSSYLFAIAKYAQLFINPVIWKLNGFQSPQDIWYNLRNYQNGKLRNAQYFIDTYFNNDIKKIPEILLNYNYRFKYFWNQNTTFNSDELGSFHGKGVYSLKEWLSNRLHILDLYFNLCAAKDFIQYYDESDKTWKNINNQLTELASSQDISILSNPNSDVLIFKNAFATENQITKSSISNIILTVKAPELSPFVIITDPSTESRFVYRYLLNNSDKYYRIHTTNNGSQETIFGGSILWTEIQEAGYFIENTLNCNSTNLNYLKSTLGVCSTYNLNTPSLHTLILNSNNYTGTFEVSRTNNKLPNLNYLDLSETRMTSINIINSNIQYIYLKNTIINELNIRDCKNIQILNLEGAIINSINIQYPWALQNNSLNLSSTIFNNIRIGESTVDGQIFEEIILEGGGNGNGNTSDDVIVQKTINAFNVKKLKLNNFKHIKTIITSNNIIEELHITNSNLSELLKPTDGTLENCIYVEDSVLHLENLINLKSISFENTLGFTTIILPNNDEIELQAYAFYETDLYYIDFADKQNGNHTLVLCDNEQHECRIFENSAFTMKSSYSIPNEPNEYLKFKVKDNTSLSRLFYISSRRTYLGAHNGIANITYSAARNFINNLGNMDQVISFEYAFHRQSNIEAKFILNAEDDSYSYSVDSLITLAGYFNLSNICNMFEHTQINFVDENFFGSAENACGKLVDNINILNFMPYNVLAYMHFNALDNIKNKITQFLFTGKDDTQAQREDNNNAIWIYGLVDNSYINVHDLLFNNEESKLVELCGFNISRMQKIDLNNLFTSKESSIESIHSVFNNLNQSKENSNLTNITKDFNLQALTKLTTLSKSFVSIDTTLENVDINKTIDILNYLDWSNQYQKLSSVNSSSTNDIFNFYKNIDFTQEENITKWNSCWSIIHQQENANYLFSNCLFMVNDYTETIQSIPYSSNSKVIRANGLFYNSTAYVKSTNEEIGIILTDNLISNLNKLHYAQNIFANCKLNGINNYPINENLLSNLSLLNSIISMFENTKIIGTHKTYNSGINKNIFYLNNLGGSICNNYILSDSNNTNGSGYPFIPENLFIHNINLTDISNVFADSDFEGYLPDNLLINQTQLSKIDNFIYNCKILPQLYKQFNSEDNVNIYNYDNNDDINTTAYVFIPDNFIHSNEINIQNVINFNLLLSNNKHNRLYLMTNTSLNGKSPENINLTINSSSVLIGKYVYRSSDNSWYYPGSQGNNYMYSENIGFINLCINDEGNNIYSEGISIDTFNLTRSNNSCLVNSELASRYYGYIFKPQTLITKDNIDSYVSKEMYFMTFGDFAVNPTNSMDKQPIPLSKDIILPPIIIHSTINADMIPPIIIHSTINADMIPSVNAFGKTLLNDMYNKYKRNCLFRANTSGQLININNIDKSFIDDIKNNNKYTITTTEITENDNTYQKFDFILQYPSIQYSFTNNSKDNPELTLETFRNTCLNNILQQIVYNNYYLLFNDWNYSIPGSDGKSILSTYYIFTLDNDNTSTNGFILLSSDDKYSKPEASFILYPSYALTVYKDDTNNDAYTIESITKQ